MGLTAATQLPTTVRKRKYQWSEDEAAAAWEMLDNEQYPSDDGYTTVNRARGAASALLAAMHQVDDRDANELGIRIGEDTPEIRNSSGDVEQEGSYTFYIRYKSDTTGDEIVD